MADTVENISVSLGSYDREILKNHIQNGRFTNKSEVIRAGLRLLDDFEHSQKLNRLRAEISKGDADIVSGHITTYDDAASLFNDIMQDD